MPKRMRSTCSSRGVSVAKTFRVCSWRLILTTASEGVMIRLSSIKSSRWLSSSSPTGVSNEIGSLAILRTFRTLSKGISILVAISSGVAVDDRPDAQLDLLGRHFQISLDMFDVTPRILYLLHHVENRVMPHAKRADDPVPIPLAPVKP